VSSANIILNSSEAEYKSLMYIKNKIGPTVSDKKKAPWSEKFLGCL
jgi:hypothetical protein